MMVEDLFRQQLVTAEILYRRPDHPWLLQTFIWQEVDMAPEFPRLERFLDYWKTNLDGPLVQVRVAYRGLFVPTDLRFISEYGLN